MPVDRDVVQRKITLVAEDLVRLRPLTGLSPEEYLSRVEAQLATERLLERIIGRMLDVNYHLAVELAGTAPRDFHRVLGEEAVEALVPGYRSRLQRCERT